MAKVLDSLTPKKNKAIYGPFEWEHLQPAPVIGVDEVGRGCLAGPVYAAAVVLNSHYSQFWNKYTDSKVLSPARREILSEEIIAHNQVGIGFASELEIEKFNILQASFIAMKRAIAQLFSNNKEVFRGHVLVDGHLKIPNLDGFVQTVVVKGDRRATPISAASIVAKVARDRLMAELAEEYPQYGFEKHKGYCTGEHQKAIQEFGPSPIHRRSFAGVREYLSENLVGSSPGSL